MNPQKFEHTSSSQMELYFDIGIHGLIGSYLDEQDLNNYKEAFDLKDPLFYINLIRFKFPEFYRPNVTGLDWEKIFLGLNFFIQYDELANEYKEFLDSVAHFKKKYPTVTKQYRSLEGQAFYEAIVETDQYRQLYPYYTEVPIEIIDKFEDVTIFHPEATKYLIVNDLIELTFENWIEVLNETEDLDLILYIVNKENIDMKVLIRAFHRVAIIGDLKLLKQIYDQISIMMVTNPPHNIASCKCGAYHSESEPRYIAVDTLYDVCIQESLTIEIFDYLFSHIIDPDLEAYIEILKDLNFDNVKLVDHILGKLPEFKAKHKFIQHFRRICIKEHPNTPKVVRILLEKYYSKIRGSEFEWLITHVTNEEILSLIEEYLTKRNTSENKEPMKESSAQNKGSTVEEAFESFGQKDTLGEALNFMKSSEGTTMFNGLIDMLFNSGVASQIQQLAEEFVDSDDEDDENSDNDNDDLD